MNWLYRFCRRGAMIYYHLFYKMEIEGRESIDFSQNYLICANHINWQDPVVLSGALPVGSKFMAKKELFKYRIVAAFLKKIGAFPVDRSANDLKAIKLSLTYLKNHENLLIFPEGTRNKGVIPLEVKPGTVMLAYKTNTPILPITIDTNYKIGKHLRVVFHAPVVVENKEDLPDSVVYEQVSTEIMKQIYAQMKYRK